jgi:SAM-dependent methyltransferase
MTTLTTPASTASQTAPQPLFERAIDVLACPYCGGDLRSDGQKVHCQGCAKTFNIDSGIPQLFAPHDPEQQKGDVTDIVKAFYEENPFPTLMEKATRGVFARLLGEQIPQGALVLEVGCGTGQLTNFLGMHYNRRVFGSDMCLHSLRLANGFRERCRIKNAGFTQMNLFRPAFKPGVFDLVISNGVLHHTASSSSGSTTRLGA